MRAPLKLMLAAASVAGAFAAAPSANADTTCQAVDVHEACVSTTGDPTTGSFGATVTVDDTVHVCVVVMASCP